jgi:hypothetical protein
MAPPERTRVAFNSGTLVDHYRVIRLLGMGGFASRGAGRCACGRGDFRSVDLSALYKDECPLLREIWDEVPHGVENDRLVVRAADPGHCAG